MHDSSAHSPGRCNAHVLERILVVEILGSAVPARGFHGLVFVRLSRLIFSQFKAETWERFHFMESSMARMMCQLGVVAQRLAWTYSALASYG
jgi:hypothetical protein